MLVLAVLREVLLPDLNMKLIFGCEVSAFFALSCLILLIDRILQCASRSSASFVDPCVPRSSRAGSRRRDVLQAGQNRESLRAPRASTFPVVPFEFKPTWGHLEHFNECFTSFVILLSSCSNSRGEMNWLGFVLGGGSDSIALLQYKFSLTLTISIYVYLGKSITGDKKPIVKYVNTNTLRVLLPSTGVSDVRI